MTGREWTVPARVSRRAVLLGAAAGAGTLALGALGLEPPAQAATFVKGADISWMPQMEAHGFGGLGTFSWEPEGYSPFTGYGSSAWDPGTRRPTSAMDGFLS